MLVSRTAVASAVWQRGLILRVSLYFGLWRHVFYLLVLGVIQLFISSYIQGICRVL